MKEKKKEPKPGFDSNGKFAKGNKVASGGVRFNFIEELNTALRTVEKKKHKTLCGHAIEKAFESNVVLIALLKKFAPDLAQVKVGQDGDVSVTFSIKDFREDQKSKNPRV